MAATFTKHSTVNRTIVANVLSTMKKILR